MYWASNFYQDEWFKELDFPYQKVDSLVLAYSELEESELEKLYDRGIINGLNATEMEILNREQCLALEPNLNPEITAGLLCSSSFIVDPVRLTMKLVENAIVNGTKLFLQRKWFINVAGISSPGLSAAPAIAQEVIALIKTQTALVPKPKYPHHPR